MSKKDAIIAISSVTDSQHVEVDGAHDEGHDDHYGKHVAADISSHGRAIQSSRTTVTVDN